MIRICLVFLLPALALFGQQPRGFYAWWDSPVVRDLNLSDAQMRSIRDTVRSYRPRLIDERAAVQKAEVEVEDLFNEDHFDPRRTSDAIDRLAASRGQLTRTVSEMAMKLRSLISVEQWRELQRRRPVNAARPQLRNPRRQE